MQDLSKWIKDSNANAVPAAQPAPAPAPAPAAAPAPAPAPAEKIPAPEQAIMLMLEPPGGANGDQMLDMFLQQYDVPAQTLHKIATEAPAGYSAERIEALRKVHCPPPAVPDPQPLLVPDTPTESDADVSDAPVWGAASTSESGYEPGTPYSIYSIDALDALKVSKPDRMKLACAALQGGRTSLYEAARYASGGKSE